MQFKVGDIPEDCGYNKQFQHNMFLHNDGVRHDIVEWCATNCHGHWGWWFDEGYNKTTMAYLSFELEEDLVLFKLTYDIANKHKK